MASIQFGDVGRTSEASGIGGSTVAIDGTDAKAAAELATRSAEGILHMSGS